MHSLEPNDPCLCESGSPERGRKWKRMRMSREREANRVGARESAWRGGGSRLTERYRYRERERERKRESWERDDFYSKQSPRI